MGLAVVAGQPGGPREPNYFLWRRRLFQAARAPKDDNRLVFPEFGQSPHLIKSQLQGSVTALFCIGREVQRSPCDRDFATTNAKKAAELDDGCPELPSSIPMTFTIRPMFSSAALRTSLPRIPCTAWLSKTIKVTPGPGGGRPVNCWLRHGAILAYRVERSGKSD